LYFMQFEILAGDGNTSDLMVLDGPGHLFEISDPDGIVDPALHTDGVITVDCSMTAPIMVTDTLITHVLCNGDATGAIDITVEGGNMTFAYSWSNMETTEDISGLAAGDYTVTITSGGLTEIQTYTVTEPPVLNISTTTTQATCNGDADGTAEVNPGGGVSPYTYLWDNAGETTQSISGLSAGTYSVTVTDANMCTITALAIVGQPSALVLNSSSTLVSCNGGNDGTATVTPSGGSPGYSYNWAPLPDTTPTVTDLSAGSYAVTVTDNNGCTAVTIIDVNEPAVFTASASATDITCEGDTDGTADATPNGGTSPFTYEWDTAPVETTQSISDLGEGTYNVTVTDAGGCTATASTIVGAPVPITATAVITHESAMDANDGAIDMTPAGGTSFYNYSWDLPSPNQDISGLAPGIYCVTITDSNGCTGEECFEVFEFAAPIITVDNSTDATCNGGSDGTISITVTDGTPPYIFDWDNDGTGDNDDDEDLTNLPAGTYTVRVIDAAMVTDTETITIGEPSAISIVMDASSDVSCNGFADGGILMTVTGGTPDYTYDWGSLDTEDISGLSGGTYILTVTDDVGCTKESVSIVIDEPDAIVITLNSTTDLACNGVSTGCIDISVSGGTPDYTYAWTGGGDTEDLCGLSAGTYFVTVTDDRGCQEVSNAIIINEPSAINVSSSSTMVSCNGEADGSIDLTVSGGAGTPYDYNWSPALSNDPDQSNLSAGTYFVTITDPDGCTVVEGPIPVTQPAELTLSNMVTNASASNDDGGINIIPNGGTPAYSYLWDTGETSQNRSGLPSGCYAVTVTDANFCTAIDSIKVGGIMVITKELNHVSCNGDDDGSIDITISGGIPPYTYDWDPDPDVEDQNNLTAGTYCVTVMDSNQSIVAECFTINEPDALTILTSIITNETGAGCNGGIDIEVIGGTPPYSYQWNNGNEDEDLINVCKADYDVVITDANGCILISNSFTVAPPPLEIADDSGISDVSCFGGSDGGGCIEILGGCGPYDITLDGNFEETSIDGEVCFDNLSAGTYEVCIVDSGTSPQMLCQNIIIDQPSPIVVTDTIITNNTDPTNTNCDGAINITVTGGTAPYNYVWSYNNMTSEDLANICELGNPYSVTITDANDCVHILEGLEIQLGLSIVITETTNVSCFDECDGEINITILGGIAPYTYEWDNGVNPVEDPIGLCPGNYSVTVTDDAGNMASQQGISITQPTSALTVNVISSTRPIGDDNNGEINLGQPTGGWGGYTYEWSNGALSQDIEGLVEGIYTVTVTDANGCQVIETIDLEAWRLILSFEEGQPSCNGDVDGSLEVFVDGGSGDYAYTWDPTAGNVASVFNLSSGGYSVTVEDLTIIGLSATAEFDLGEPDILEVEVVCGNENGMLVAQVTGGTEPYSYLWNNSPENDTVQIVAGLRPGEYSVRVEDANGCVEIARGETCDDGSDCFDAREIISVNGDGVNDLFVISCVETYNNTLRIFNRWGQLVFEATNYDNSWMGTDLDGNDLPEDGYFYVLEYEDGGENIQLKGAITVLR
jgi:gliding motility-associated-like protein